MDGVVWLGEQGHRMRWSGQTDRPVVARFYELVPAEELAVVLAGVEVVDAHGATFVDLGAVHLLEVIVHAHELARCEAVVRVVGAPPLLGVMCQITHLAD